MELKERIEIALTYEKTKKQWRSKFSNDEFIFCSQLNFDLFGKKFNRSERCECIEDFFILIKNRIKNVEIMDKLFITKGVIRGTGMRPIGATSSDEDCIKLLKMNKNFIKHFEKYPANWEAIVDGEEAPAPVEVTAPAPVEVTAPAPVEVTAPAPVEVVAPAPVEVVAMTVAQLKAHAKSIGLELISNRKETILEEIEAFTSEK
jgi:hypothetical protein